ncbi:DUF3488 and transglutaminase-like domain-containing protein [Microbacterium sp. C7(2022)]|uniref:transglutaminase family protein n=1 Tax=Microbacterium sp. C7(2022) TaxID=2992759 RepID=UPI00237B384B|nr:DUF3488 and transglutaminase-like domain-containing protein [Microbacterium sp. C7(2022)]MDE0546034.1 DUF3488 and transglutaminase-like domain-containing protein [Microbacterium sp. C7(2022)]
MSWRDAASTPAPASDASSARRGARTLTLAVYLTLLAAIFPVVRVVKPGAWLWGSIVLAALILAAGYGARRLRLRAVAVSLIEAGVWLVFMTGVFFSSSALLWVFPTPATVREVPPVIEQAVDEIVLGAAPLDPTAALAVLIVGAMGLLAIIVDHVVITARMPLLASVGIIAVSLIPAIAVDISVDVVSFIWLAAAILFLLRAETRSREKPAEQSAEKTAGVPATAVGIAAIAVVVAVVASPLLPEPTVHAGSGVGPGPGIDASLALGDDLRRPQEVEVLRYTSDATTPPYLRATTLTRFDGAIWKPDPARTVPLNSGYGLDGVNPPDDVRVAEYLTSVEVINLSSYWLPIPWAATDVTGLEGDWSVVPANLTVLSQSATTQGQTYTVASEIARPTREQIRQMDAVKGARIGDDTLELPLEMPPIIAELAAEVTAEATNDYDRLIALQRWFRGGEFEYSLDAPVEDGFDGTGVEAVAQFLEVREGYCVHFASAFALMARTLDMPTRIVVGYLPGGSTGDVQDGQSVYSVTSDKLHAWPEVYFDELGWIAFEPTTSLGTPTNFSPASLNPGTSDGGTTDRPEDRPTPTASASGTSLDPDMPLGGSSGVVRVDEVDLAPMFGMIAAIVVLLAAPGVIHVLRRRGLISASREGDAAAAWALVQNTAIDVGVSVPASESPRAFAQRLTREHGVPPASMNALVRAIESASYSRAAGRGFENGETLATASSDVCTALVRAVPVSRRILAVVVPRSLLIRPGSVYAGAAAEPASSDTGASSR